jgi:hypothetical protein
MWNNQQKDAKWFAQIEKSGKFENTWWHAAKYIRKATTAATTTGEQ